MKVVAATATACSHALRCFGSQGAKFLENNTEADYRRYNEQLFDILIAGGLLGTVLQCTASDECTVGIGAASGVCLLQHMKPPQYPLVTRTGERLCICVTLLRFLFHAAPGGSIVADGAAKNPFSCFETEVCGLTQCHPHMSGLLHIRLPHVGGCSKPRGLLAVW